MNEPVAEVRYQGDVHVRPYRRGTYLGGTHLEELIERTLADRYSFGRGWRGFAVVSVRFYEHEAGGKVPEDGGVADAA